KPSSFEEGLRALELEVKLHRELHSSRSAATEKRIADAHITGRSQRQEPDTASSYIQSVVSRIGDEVGQVGIGEVRMIEQVEEFETKLHLHPLGETGIFHHREVELFEGWSDQRIPAHVSEVAGSGETIAVTPGPKSRRISESTGNFE